MRWKDLNTPANRKRILGLLGTMLAAGLGYIAAHPEEFHLSEGPLIVIRYLAELLARLTFGI